MSPLNSFPVPSPLVPPDPFKIPSMEPFLSAAQTNVKLQISSIPSSIPSPSAPSYAERFKSSLRNLRKISDPSFLEDGIPVVQAPAEVLLQTSDLWKDHIVAQFHGRVPPPGKIYADLNPVWGKFGNITVRKVSYFCYLIFIPSIQTREWALQVGYWQTGHCAFFVFPWSPVGTLAAQELQTAPTWAILKNVPPQLYSLDGISVVASAIGEPLHTEKARLDPYHFGDTKVKIEINLESPPPEVVEVRDAQGNSVRIQVVYPRLPPKCCNCGKFGHLLPRCPRPLLKKTNVHFQETGNNAQMAMTSSPIVLGVSASPQLVVAPLAEPSLEPSAKTLKRARSRSRARGRSSPPDTLHSECVARADKIISQESNSEVSLEKGIDSKSKEGLFAPVPSCIPVSADAKAQGSSDEADDEGWVVKQSKWVRRTLRQEALWKTSGNYQSAVKGSSFLSRGSPSGKKV